jgi:hypothetical protein
MSRLYHYTLLQKVSYKTVPSEQKVSWTFIRSRTETLENGLLHLLRRMLHSLFHIQIAAVKLYHAVCRIHEQQDQFTPQCKLCTTRRLLSQGVTSFEVLHIADEPWVLLGMWRWVYRTVNLCDRTEIILPFMSHTEPDNIAVDARFTLRLTLSSTFTSLKTPGRCYKKALPGWRCRTPPDVRLWDSGGMTVPGEIREGSRRRVCFSASSIPTKLTCDVLELKSVLSVKRPMCNYRCCLVGLHTRIIHCDGPL